MQKDSSSITDAWAIKLGGSLYNSRYLVECMEDIRQCSQQNVVIIPGGGPFADQVRLADEKYSIHSPHSHHMAILAMQQFGYLLASICPDFVLANSKEKITQAWNVSKTVIWEPYEMVRDQCTLEKTWDVTSDSLAAWLASILGIRNMLLIKSSKTVLETSELTELVRTECVDAHYPGLAKKYLINTHFLHKSKTKNLSQLLNSSK